TIGSRNIDHKCADTMTRLNQTRSLQPRKRLANNRTTNPLRRHDGRLGWQLFSALSFAIANALRKLSNKLLSKASVLTTWKLWGVLVEHDSSGLWVNVYTS